METVNRVAFIRGALESAGADGVVFANSGGKDCVLVGILCKKACDNTVGLILPCGTKRNYESDLSDAKAVSEQYDIAARIIDLARVKNEFIAAIGGGSSTAGATPTIVGATPPAGDATPLSANAAANIAARLRMIALYSVSVSENRLVAGTGNRSERYMGYFTKWGDGAYDFNPIADLTVTEIYEFLRYLGAPAFVIDKAPSAGLYEGQTDEADMGVTYRSIDDFLLNGVTNDRDMAIIERYHKASGHKRTMPPMYREAN